MYLLSRCGPFMSSRGHLRITAGCKVGLFVVCRARIDQAVNATLILVTDFANSLVSAFVSWTDCCKQVIQLPEFSVI